MLTDWVSKTLLRAAHIYARICSCTMQHSRSPPAVIRWIYTITHTHTRHTRLCAQQSAHYNVYAFNGFTMPSIWYNTYTHTRHGTRVEHWGVFAACCCAMCVCVCVRGSVCSSRQSAARSHGVTVTHIKRTRGWCMENYTDPCGQRTENCYRPFGAGAVCG